MQNKARLNLYLDRETIEFAKKWSYVTNISISRMLEGFLKEQQNLVSTKTPFQWVSDNTFSTPLSKEEKELQDLEEYLNNKEEKEFCEQNPDHPRAKMRSKLTDDYKKLFHELRVMQKELEKEIVQRWMKVFSAT